MTVYELIRELTPTYCIMAPDDDDCIHREVCVCSRGSDRDDGFKPDLRIEFRKYDGGSKMCLMGFVDCHEYEKET